jgi:hypothetical protein
MTNERIRALAEADVRLVRGRHSTECNGKCWPTSHDGGVNYDHVYLDRDCPLHGQGGDAHSTEVESARSQPSPPPTNEIWRVEEVKPEDGCGDWYLTDGDRILTNLDTADYLNALEAERDRLLEQGARIADAYRRTEAEKKKLRSAINHLVYRRVDGWWLAAGIVEMGSKQLTRRANDMLRALLEGK